MVGTVDAGTQSANVDNVRAWANYLLGLGENVAPFNVDADLNGTTEEYATGINAYAGTLTGGTRVNGATPDIETYEWVMGKYNGKNAGYVLFNVDDYLAAYGGTKIPEYSDDIWTTNGGNGYQLSNITGFGTRTPRINQVPDGGATLLLLGMAIASLGGIPKLLAMRK